MSLGINNIAIITVRSADYHCVSKSEAINLLENYVFDNKRFMQNYFQRI